MPKKTTAKPAQEVARKSGASRFFGDIAALHREIARRQAITDAMSPAERTAYEQPVVDALNGLAARDKRRREIAARDQHHRIRLGIPTIIGKV
jgi:hypothetical protein